MDSDVEEVKNRISVVDLVGEYVRLTKAGSNWRALCPFHNEKTPSFMVSEERRSFHCFGCGKGGDIFTFMMEMEGIGFREALEQLAAKAGVELKKFARPAHSALRSEAGGGEKAKLYQILELATKWYEKNLWEGKGKEKILGYLRERGLSDESIRKFRLGYAPEGWRNVLDFLVKKGYKIEEIARTGLLVEKDSDSKIPDAKYQILNTKYYDRFRDRIMFPIQDIMGRVVGYSARVAPGGDEKTAKYVNTPQTVLYDKSNVLYGLHLAKMEIKKKGEVILVEGNTDVIASHQAGFPNTIAVSGTALTPEQVKIIKRYADDLKMAYDMDAAGQAAAKRSIRICLEGDLNVKIVLLSAGKDAADTLKEKKDVWKEALEKARGVIEYYFQDAFSRHDAKIPAEKKRIAKDLLNVMKDIADPVEKAHWVKELSRRLDIGEKVLLEVLEKAGEKKERKFSTKSQPEPVAEAGRDKILEKRIIGLALAFPKETEKRRILVNADNFSGEERKIFEEILKDAKAGLEKVKQNIFGYEAQKTLDEAVFEVEAEAEQTGSGAFDPAAEFAESARQLARIRAAEKIAALTKKIKEAENAGDKESAKKLMQEFQVLSEEAKS